MNNPKKILVIGSGGREHALVWKLHKSKHHLHLYCAPGNAGIANLAELVPIYATEKENLLKFALSEKIDLTIVGPEQPLIDGIVDLFEEHQLRIFGPSKMAARIEGEKVFSKNFMKRHNIPTADFQTFEISQRYDAERHINDIPAPIVIKADGPAGGKGVVICDTKEQALLAIEAIMGEKIFGEAGSRIVIEEFLIGEEISVLILTDGKEYVKLIPVQDHKRIFDGDKGKNTGGMGAYAPVPFANDELIQKIDRQIIRPTLRGMSKEGYPFRGCLYAGIILTEVGPKVLEFNCRFGDPETQVLLPLLKNDLFDLMLELSFGKLKTKNLQWLDKSAVCVVIASGGYPDLYQMGKKIIGLENVQTDPDIIVFHAGTRKEKESFITSGGRVIGVTALDAKNNLEGAISKAYRAVEKITFDGAYYRSDIGQKGLQRLINNV